MSTPTHPPIPPGSKRFEEVGGPLAVLFHGGHSWGDYLHHPQRYAAHRDIIAAVAEVEWRKRAERWMRLSTRYSPWSKRYSRARYTCFSAEETQAWKNAILWRAWGANENQHTNTRSDSIEA